MSLQQINREEVGAARMPGSSIVRHARGIVGNLTYYTLSQTLELPPQGDTNVTRTTASSAGSPIKVRYVEALVESLHPFSLPSRHHWGTLKHSSCSASEGIGHLARRPKSERGFFLCRHFGLLLCHHWICSARQTLHRSRTRLALTRCIPSSLSPWLDFRGAATGRTGTL